MKLALLSNVVMDMVAKSLRHEVYIPAGFNTWLLALSDAASVFNTESFGAAFVFLHCKDEKRGWNESADGEAALDSWLSALSAAAARKPETLFFIANLDIEIDVIRPVCAPQPERGWEFYWQSGICALSSEHANVFLFDLKSLVEEHGRAVFYSPKMWYASASPYSLKGIRALADEIESLLGASSRKKVLVTDLDNTLWGGVAGEDGVDGLTLAAHMQGARYYDLQLRLRELTRTGALLAVASKNNAADAYAVVDGHPHMALRREDFAAVRIDWGDKPENIRAMAEELNLGLDSFVFLDDNPLEREIVRGALPQVTVADFPDDTSLLEKTALTVYRRHFRALRATDEDAGKTRMYRAQSQRKAVQAAAATPADYIRALEMEVTLGRMTEQETDRVAQLCNKTNQFNLTTNRYDRGAVHTLANTPGCAVLTIRCRDRFGENGLVGVMIVRERGVCALIDTFLLSCRVMGRMIEDHTVAAVAAHYRRHGFEKLEGRFIPTEKNAPVAQLYDRLGFDVTACSPEQTDYALDLTAARAEPPHVYKTFAVLL